MSNYKFDSLHNFNTKLGASGRDTTKGNAISTPTQFTRTELDIAFTNAWPLRRACEEPVKYALQPWGKLTVQDSEDHFLINAIKAKLGGNRVFVQDRLDKGLNAQFYFQQAQICAEIYGGAGIVLLIDDGNMYNFSQPVNVNRIKSVRGLRLYDGWDLSPFSAQTNDGRFEPSFYTLGASRVMDEKGNYVNTGLKVHKDRVLPFTGTSSLTEYQGSWLSNGWWGDSRIRQCLDATKNYLGAHQAIAHAIQSFEVTTLKIKGLLDKLASSGNSQDYTKLVTERMESILKAYSLFGMLLLDEEEESIEHTSRRFQGVDKMIEQLERNLVAATNLPKFILYREYGSQLGQLGEHEQEDFNLLTGGIQQKITPNLQTLITYILLSKEFVTKGKLPSSFDWEWNPTRQKSEKEISEIKQIDAGTFTKYIDSGVLDADTVRDSLFGGTKYSSEINLPEEDDMLMASPTVSSKQDAKSFIPPKGVAEEAQKPLRWRNQYPDEIKGGTTIGWTRANQLANQESVSLDTINRMVSFFARHEGNRSVSPENKRKPWRDAGRVAWLLWGGDAGRRWANKISKQEKNNRNDAYEDLTSNQQVTVSHHFQQVANSGRYSQEEVGLQPSPFLSEGRRCGNCAFYPKDAPMSGEGGCSIVEGKVTADDWCQVGVFPSKWLKSNQKQDILEDNSVRSQHIEKLADAGYHRSRLDTLTDTELQILNDRLTYDASHE